MQSIDHLNVCKAASPALQVVNLAGTAVGFVYLRHRQLSEAIVVCTSTNIPFHLSFVAGMATSAAAIGGMFAVDRVRITRYLIRASKEYFVPRGLCVQLLKHKNLENFIPALEGPFLAPLDDSDLQDPPKLHKRRLAALGDFIAPLEIQEGLLSEERNILDKLSAKFGRSLGEETREEGHRGARERQGRRAEGKEEAGE